MNEELDQFYSSLSRWKAEMNLLRGLVLETGLVETMKWKNPCYTSQGKNIAMIAQFKDYCAVSFFKGALLKDENNVLQQPGKHSQAVRLLRYTNSAAIHNQEHIIKAYLFEAIQIEKDGQKIAFADNETLQIPEELAQFFRQDSNLKMAFEALTPGRRRGYILHFTGAKQSKTRASRIKKMIPRILDGFGIHDCTCGLSKRLPSCDGSHNKTN